MWKVCCNACSMRGVQYGREFETAGEAKAYCEHLSKHYKNYDVFKNGELVATGDRYGCYAVRKPSKRLTGSVGYAQMMTEKN